MKYKNRKTACYDSTKEKRRADVLKLLQLQGIISDLHEQVRFELIPAQYENGKCVERECFYVADFVYTEKGNRIVEDVKGFKTPDYIIKRKLMLEKHGIKVKEV